MTPYLSRLLNHLRPREGWIPFLLVLVALLSPSGATLEGTSGLGTFGMVALTIAAALIGRALAQSRRSARTVTILGALMGVGLVTVVVGRILPPLSLLWTDAGYALGWLRAWQQGLPRWPLPFSSSVLFVWQQINALGVRLWLWAQTLSGGGQTQDNIVALLLAALLAWAFALFATWQIYRRRSALLALLPAGLTTAIIAFFQGGVAVFYLVLYLFCTLWLLAICRLWTHRERWDQQGTDYPDSLGTELLLSFGPLLTLMVIVAALFPMVYIHPVRDAFWRVMDVPWSRVERAAEQFLGPIDTGISRGAVSSSGSGGEMPRSHLLGGRPDLSETRVLYVTTSDPPPPPEPDEPGLPSDAAGAISPFPNRYWRGDTYDTYTGIGWTNSRLESQSLSSDRFLDRNPPPGPVLRQQFQRLASVDKRVYAVNSPFRLDSPVQAWWREPGDLAFLRGEAGVYTVFSRPPEPTIAELRALSPITSPLPAEVAERYLVLPDTLPQRVLDLAQQVVGDAPTRYDQARAIETYLRTYPYNLDLPDPPTDRDLVDHFLFDLQEGYCDYYASSMVVMARAMGVPARLASGYVQGTYDREAQRWVVTEEEGHTWVEVYFDNLGWVEFEPTAGRSALLRPGRGVTAAPVVPPLPARYVPWWLRAPWGLIAISAVLLLLLSLVLWIWWPRPQVTSAELAEASAGLVRDRHARLLRWGTRLRLPLRDGQTAREYSQDLAHILAQRGKESRLPWTRQAGEQAPAQVKIIAETFVRTQYGPGPTPEREARRVRDIWPRLRRHLWSIRLSVGSRKYKETDHLE